MNIHTTYHMYKIAVRRKCVCKYFFLREFSSAAPITALIIFVIVSMAPLLGGCRRRPKGKKCPPALLLNFFSLQYPASECTAKIILLALYDIIASSCVAH